MPGWDNNWNAHGGYGWFGGLVMLVTMILLWGGLITVGILLLRRVGYRDSGQDSARRILDERFARGEIDRDEYEQRIQAMRSAR